MSAWDIAGAVMATPLAIFALIGMVMYLNGKDEPGENGAALAFLVFWPALALSVYCVARLAGVHP